jgi:hypothetical protein
MVIERNHTHQIKLYCGAGMYEYIWADILPSVDKDKPTVTEIWNPIYQTRTLNFFPENIEIKNEISPVKIDS